MADLDVSAAIETPTGWLELEDVENGYHLAADSFSEAATSHRKTEITSEWIDGTFVTRAVRDNVAEKVSVYVTGSTPFQLAERLDRLTNGLDQVSYQMVVRFVDCEEQWSCWVAEYSLSTKAEMRRATMALVTATVPRLPNIIRTKVFT